MGLHKDAGLAETTSPAWTRWRALRTEEALRVKNWNDRRRQRFARLPKPLAFALEKSVYYGRRTVGTLLWALDRAYHCLVKPHLLSKPDLAAERARRLKLDLFLSNPKCRLTFPVRADPLVTILILSYNRAEQLLECLESIQAHTGDVPYELVVADNASTDRAPEVLRRVDGAKVVFSDKNLGFVRGNNEAAKLARGRYLLLLNNDTLVTPSWLSEMTRTLESWPLCGAVGPRLLFPDGRLQEAGAVVWSDGRVDAIGHGDDPLAGPYQHVREVDFCSGACLLLRTDVFRQIGGLNDDLAPAYYEDVDLCFAVRSLGLAVVYQPGAVLFHHGPTAKSLAGTLELCRANQGKFVERWRKELTGHVSPRHRGDLFGARDRRAGPRILVIDRPDSLVIAELARRGAVITFVPLSEEPADSSQWLDWRQAGVEVLPGGEPTLLEIGRLRVGAFDAILLGEIGQASAILELLDNWLPATPIYRSLSDLLLHDSEKLPQTSPGPGGCRTTSTRALASRRGLLSRAALAWAALSFVGIQVGTIVLTERWRPELRHPEAGYRHARLQERRAAEPGRPLVLVLGSSRTELGFCPEILPAICSKNRTPALVFNYGITSSGPIDELVALRSLLREGIRPTCVLVEILPGFYGGGTETTMACYPNLPRMAWSDLAVVRRYFRQPWKAYLQWTRAHLVPVYSSRFFLMSQLAPDWLMLPLRSDWLRRSLGTSGWTLLRQSVTPEEHRCGVALARSQYSRSLMNLRVGSILDRATRDLLELCLKERIAVAFFLMPEGSEFRSWYSESTIAALNDYLSRLIRELHVPVIDAREWVVDADFMDDHHLLPRGAVLFTERLGREAIRPLLDGTLKAVPVRLAFQPRPAQGERAVPPKDKRSALASR